jgi:phage tail-like protein
VSSYMVAQLPVVMAADEQLSSFLYALDEIASDLYDRAGTTDQYLDPSLAPLPLVRWWARHLCVDIDADRSDRDQRTIASTAAATFTKRGTAASLIANLTALTGSTVTLSGPGVGRISAVRTALTRQSAESTARSAPLPPPALPLSSTLTITLTSLGRASLAQARDVARRELSAHVPFDIEVAPATSRAGVE